MNQDKIGNIIKQIRKENHLTQAELAEKLGVTYQAVSKWENGKNIPDIEIIKQICKEYKIDINELLDTEVKTKKKRSYLFLIPLLILIVIGGILLWKNRDTFEMRRIITNNSDFKITGSIAYDNKGKIYIYISDIDYDNNEDQTIYKNIKATLYEDYNNKNTKIKECEHEEHDITLKEHLNKVTFNIDDYKSSCNDLSKSKLYLEVEATDYQNKTIYYKIPLELEELCPEK